MKRKKFPKKILRSVIISAVVAVAVTALLITNIFIPVKYFSAYIVFVKDVLPENGARVTFIDVDYGDSILVELPDGKTMLIDGGDGSYPHELELLSVLNKRGVTAIDYLICTSVNKEHCGGLAEIIKYKKVSKIYMPYCTVTRINDSFYNFYESVYCGAEIDYCEYGNGEIGDGWSFCFLTPTVHTATAAGSEYYELNSDPTDENINNASAVVWLECLGVDFLFLSDATTAVCDKIIAAYSVDGLMFGGKSISLTDCDIVSVAMHGGEDGTCAPLYDLIRPHAAVISVGDNGYGAPSLAAIADAQACVADNLYRTDTHGTVTVTVRDGNFTIN